jgi:DNA polymerase-1
LDQRNLPSHVAVDVETVDLDGPALVLALAPNAYEAFCFDFDEPLWRNILKGRTLIFHNAHYDLEKLDWKGEFEDTYLIYGALGEESLSLKRLAWDKALLEFITAKELMDKHHARNMLGVPKNEMMSMCCLHARATYAIWERIPEIPRVYYELDKPMIPILIQMEKAGLYIDQEEVQHQLDEHIPLRNEAMSTFQTIYGALNMNSHPQLSKALNLSSTAEDAIADLAFPGKEALLEYRGHLKLISTYLLPFQQRVDSKGRIHTRLDYTHTGRLRSFRNKGSEEGMALQNLPNGDLRKCIAAPKGYSLIDVDYSQLELRVLAHISGDPVMLEAFDKDMDLHQKTADDVLLDSTKRRLGKTLNFALVYGAEERKISELIGCNLEEAAAIKKRVFTTYPGFASWVKEVQINARKTHMVETMFGRRRNLYKLGSASRREVAEGLREATNTLSQSAAVDIVKIAMLELCKLNLILQVHDEILFEEAEPISDTLIETIRDVTESAYPLRAHLKVEIKQGHNYLEVH